LLVSSQSSQGSDDSSGVPGTLVDVRSEVGAAFGIMNDEVRDAVVVQDESVGGFIWYHSLGIKLSLESVDCCGIEVCLVSEVSVVQFDSVGEGDGDVFGILESDGGV
jgi:hypothetical protein